MTDTTETGPAREDSTERCTNDSCGHTKRDHSGRRDHTTKHPDIPLRPWCHACKTECLYEPDAATVPAPAPTGRAAVLREAAERYERLLDDMSDDKAKDPRYWQGVQHVTVGLRGLADAASGPGGVAGGTQQPDPAAPELTAEEARALVDQMGLDLYRAQDAIEFARECCDIADREQRPVTTADVREWLKGDRCTRQRAADEAQQPETQAPADPWSIDYHQLGPARLNPAVCICGLGPDAVIHNEPAHQFNSRLKAAHHAAVHGICTDCHHHESAACHTAAVSQPDEEA